MSEKIHLHARIFRIHGLDLKLLASYDLDAILIGTLFRSKVCEVACCLVSVDDLVAIFLELSFDDLFYKIDGDLHIAACLFRADDGSFNGNGNFYLLLFSYD